jgi:hypothetical protein
MIGTKLGRYPGLSIACLIHCTLFGWWRYNCVRPRSRSSSVAASEYDSDTFWFIQAIDTWCELLVLCCISSAARRAKASARSFPVLPSGDEAPQLNGTDDVGKTKPGYKTEVNMKIRCKASERTRKTTK